MVVLGLVTMNVYGQEYRTTFPQTHKSIITFSNGESAEGWVRFYDESKMEVLDQNGESVYLGPSEVRQFEYTVGDSSIHRKFVSLEFREHSYTATRLCFFEVLKEIPGHLSLLLHTEKLKSQGWHPTSSPDLYRFDMHTNGWRNIYPPLC